MKVAFLAQRSSIHTVRWVNALAQRGYEVHLISMHEDVHELHPEVVCHVLPRPLPAGYFSNIKALKQLLNRLEPALLHTHFASGYGTLGRLSGFHPNVLSVWGSDVYDFPSKSPLHHGLIAQNLRRADWLCSTSYAMAAQTKTIYPVKGISVTPFGIDTGRFAPRSHSDDSESITIGTVKTLAPNYGIDLLLKAFATLLESVNTELAACLRLKIVGGGPQEKELMKLAETLNIVEQTQFVGQVAHKDVPRWLNELDVYAALSRSESFGVAILEASACGLPVVVANVGGLPEVVKEGETGFIVEKESVSGAAEVLKKLVLDSSLRKRMGIAGRKHVVEHYDWERSVDLMEKVYQQVTEKTIK